MRGRIARPVHFSDVCHDPLDMLPRLVEEFPDVSRGRDVAYEYLKNHLEIHVYTHYRLSEIYTDDLCAVFRKWGGCELLVNDILRSEFSRDVPACGLHVTTHRVQEPVFVSVIQPMDGPEGRFLG